MKTKILLLFFMVVSIHAIGQELNDSIVKSEPKRKNVIKFLPVNLLANSLSFEYERKFSPKSSFILGVGLASPKPFADKYNLNNSADNKISNEEFSTMAIRAAYRHYSGHHIRPVGFYFSPYLKYQKFSAKADNYRTVSDPQYGSTSFNEKYDVNGNTLNFGLQWGVQFMLAKRVAVDFYFLGIEAGLADITATVRSDDATSIDEVYKGVTENIDQLPSFLRDKIKATKVGSNQVDVEGSSIPYPWLRSGISIGIAF
jgi:hypothetical protein